MGRINIIPVGSGSTGNSIYIEIGERKILVDMGMGFKVTRDVLAKHGRDIKDIEAIFLTHLMYCLLRSFGYVSDQECQG